MKAAALFLAMLLPAADFTRPDLTLRDDQLAGDWYELELAGADRRNEDVYWVIKAKDRLANDQMELEVWQKGKKVNGAMLKVDQSTTPWKMQIAWSPATTVPATVSINDNQLLVLLGPGKPTRILFKRRQR